MTHGPAALDLLDVGIFANGYPHALFDRVRSETPVYRNPGGALQDDFWVLLRHADVEDVSRDPGSFCSGRGFRLFSNLRTELDPDIQQSLARTVLAMDDPEHALYRKLFNPSVSTAALRRLEPLIEQQCDALFASLRGRDTVEFVTEVSAIIPIRAICALLGIPAEDEAFLFDITNRVLGTDDPEFAPTVDATNASFRELFDYGRRLVADRRRQPRDDLMTVVASVDTGDAEDDRRLHEAFVSTLIAAGNETTRNCFTGIMLALHDFPDQRQLLREQPELTAKAIPEFLRFVSPVVQMLRTATRDTEVGGQAIRAGERVVMLYPAANRDPAMFADPHRLDVRRGNANRNLGFGVGVHHCLGARLATIELTQLTRALLRHFPEYRPASAPRYLASNFVAGAKSVEVALGTPAMPDRKAA